MLQAPMEAECSMGEPAAPDAKRVLRQLATQHGRKFGFRVGVKDAQRLIPVSHQEASAAYWWSRVATTAKGGAHYILGRERAAWFPLSC